MDKSLENSLRYISDELKSNPQADRKKLIDETSVKFDLTPIQTEFLLNKYIFNK
jgi:hypothetical protein